ncbi:MAG TPA: BadF/BadG/BcrA/BcrD ATPase family protein [Gemmatimonadales bacterium]|jgi:N-acetylglucosamine kinase-like BadF-type ATPase
MTTAALLGIDAGGSHTTVVVADAHARVLGRVDGPASAVRPGGIAASAAVILDTARRAVAQAEASLPATAAVVGAAGAGRDPEQSALGAALAAGGLAHAVRVVGDGEIALVAAFGEEPGILVSAGTGSIAFARPPGPQNGRLHRAGGYGWQLGDEGGGYWLGRRALTAAARAYDGVDESSTLSERLLVALGLPGFDELVRWAATATPAQVAALAPHVLNAAQEGEVIAQRAVFDAANELAQLVRVLAQHFPGAEPIPVAPAGGLLRRGSPLLAGLRVALGAAVPRARLVDGPVDAALGALRLAAQLV